jgi:hypothetical protein
MFVVKNVNCSIKIRHVSWHAHYGHKQEAVDADQACQQLRPGVLQQQACL